MHRQRSRGCANRHWRADHLQGPSSGIDGKCRYVIGVVIGYINKLAARMGSDRAWHVTARRNRAIGVQLARSGIYGEHRQIVIERVHHVSELRSARRRSWRVAGISAATIEQNCHYSQQRQSYELGEMKVRVHNVLRLSFQLCGTEALSSLSKFIANKSTRN